jgi:hypothetical protein
MLESTIILFVLYASFLVGVFMLSFGFSTLFMLDFRNIDEYNQLKQKELDDYDIKTMKDNYDDAMINNFLSCFMFNVKEVVDRFEYKIYKDNTLYFMIININHLHSSIILDRSNGFYHLYKNGGVIKSGLLSSDSMIKIDALIDIEEKYQFTKKIIEHKPELKTL